MGAVAYLLLVVVTGASLARLGQRKVNDSVLRGAESVASAEIRDSALRDARHRARRASDLLGDTEAAASAVATHIERMGQAPVDTSPAPFAFAIRGSHDLPVFASELHDLVGIAPDPEADAAVLSALAWRGVALTAALRTARLQVPEDTRFAVWIRGEGVLLHPGGDPEQLCQWLAPHAGFGQDVVAATVGDGASWLQERTSVDGARTLPHAVPLVDEDGETWAVVRCDVSVDDLLPSLVQGMDDEPLCHPVVLDSTGRVIASSNGASVALGLDAEHRDDLAAIGAALTPFVGDDGFLVTARGGEVKTGGSVFFATAPVADVGWTLGVVAPRSAVIAAAVPASEESSRAVRDFAIAVFGFSAVFGLLAAVAGMGFADSLRRRLIHLVRAASAHADGHLEARAPVTGGDELAAVAHAINTTAVRMQENMRRLEESRRRLSGLIESMAEGLVITDMDDRITFVNGRFAAVLKRAGDSLIGHFLEEFLIPQSLEAYRGELRRRRDGASSRHEVTWQNTGSQHPRTIVSAMPLFDADGRYTGTCCVVTDITTRAKAQEETARAEKLRALGEMAGGVAHDFNNVLTAVLGNTQYLLQEPLDDEVRETLRIIETAAMDGTETVNRIRKFTRPSAGVHDAGPVDANSAASDVLKMARPRFERAAREDDVEYEVILERNALRHIRGNASEVREVLLNLVFNALDAMPHGGTLTVEAFDRGEDAVGLRVTDTGDGIPDENLGKIFDPFFSTKRGGRCSGLGLSICFGIVRAHGGRIDVRSEAGIGTTFTVVLPAFAASPDEPGAPEAGLTPPEPRVLLVSPRRRQAQGLQKSLNGRGLHVALVDNATVASDLLADPGIFNTLLVEHGLGNGSGWELARTARRVRPDLRIVLLTEPEKQLDETQARNAGIDRTLVRPFDGEDVHGVVLSVLAVPPMSAAPDRESAPTRRRNADTLPQVREIWGTAAVVKPVADEALTAES